MNDLLCKYTEPNSDIIGYADDITVICWNKNLIELKNTIESIMRKITNWCESSKLRISKEKMKHTFSFRKIQIVENFWSPWKMAISEPKSAHLREVLLFAFNWKKSATEAHRMLEEIYGDHALSKSQCYRWFKKFQSGDFELDNENHVENRPKSFRMLNCKLCWMRIVPKRRRNS
ncbi:hypothetical protein LAZ67_4002666 [Cordylochernes scorpioides]|uniref:Mos1 transposase HTH domain-containing protein n=1 Tax=Cordylochernes scorpioides TaxID=51811 RepID=A0ABY6KCZ3_9ARAC|nr:hypothetical protein LAZ67_4002666 [Cordylochernes scorpioides]